ncbi:MAG: HAD family hydrolase, partial [bacterium]
MAFKPMKSKHAAIALPSTVPTNFSELNNSDMQIDFQPLSTMNGHRDEYKLYELHELTVSEKYLVASLARHSTHPLSYQVMKWLSIREYAEVEHFHEVPGCGIAGTVDGRKIRLGARAWIFAVSDVQPSALSKKFQTGTLQHELRTSEKDSIVTLEIDGEIRGDFHIANNYRPRMAEVLRDLKKKFTVYLISGDNDSEKPKLEAIFGNSNGSMRLHFNQSPTDKLNFIENLQSHGKRVLMVSDGLNDAGAL